MNTLLIGPRACGKTSVGRHLARRRGLRFVDLDDRVLAGLDAASVREAWARHGEARWRAAEVQALEDVLGASGQIVALGGGTPMIEAARAAIAREQAAGRAVVVYLKCPREELGRRLRAAEGDRPSLTGADVAAETDVVLRRREPTYEALADVVVEAGGRTPDDVAEAVSAAVLGPGHP